MVNSEITYPVYYSRPSKLYPVLLPIPLLAELGSSSPANVRESKKVLGSEFHAVDSGLQVLDSGIFVAGTWIPDSNR